MGVKIMERKYLCKNGVVERTRYPVRDNARPRSSRKKGNTNFRKQEANFNAALRRVARILNCNFDHENGLLVTLDYDPAGMEKLCAQAGLTESEKLWALGMQKAEIGEWKAAKMKDEKRVDVGIDPYENTEEACARLRAAAE